MRELRDYKLKYLAPGAGAVPGAAAAVCEDARRDGVMLSGGSRVRLMRHEVSATCPPYNSVSTKNTRSAIFQQIYTDWYNTLDSATEFAGAQELQQNYTQ